MPDVAVDNRCPHMGFLAAHFPTVRARRQTLDIALRMHRGEAIHDLDE